VEALRAADEVRVVAPVPWPRALRGWGIGRGRGGTAHREAGTEGEGGASTLRPIYLYPPKVLQWHYGWFMWHSVRGTVTRVLGTFRPEAVLGYWAHPDGEAALHAARLAGIPVGLIVGGSDLLVLTHDPRRRRAVSRVLQSVDAVFPVGSDLAARAAELGVGLARIHELRQGVDPERFSLGDPQAARKRLGAEPGVPLLLFVGNLVPVKGLEVLFEAAAQLAGRGVDFRLWLVGDGPLRRSLEKRGVALGLASKLRFFGTQPHGELPDFFRAADLTILSSHSEGVPNVLRESLACGTPFVATRVGGIADIATEDCELVPPGEPRSLMDAIARRLTRPLAKRSVAPHTWQESASTVRRVLASLIEQKRANE